MTERLQRSYVIKPEYIESMIQFKSPWGIVSQKNLCWSPVSCNIEAIFAGLITGHDLKRTQISHEKLEYLGMRATTESGYCSGDHCKQAPYDSSGIIEVSFGLNLSFKV